MVISSRTPEGSPGRCPLCGKEVCIEPSSFFDDAPCPHCGNLLWLVNIGSGVRYYGYDASAELREAMRRFIASQLGVSKDLLPEDWKSLKISGVESLDMVELLMGLEEFGEEFDKGGEN